MDGVVMKVNAGRELNLKLLLLADDTAPVAESAKGLQRFVAEF